MRERVISFLKKVPPVWYVAIVVAVVMSCFAAANPLLATDAICRHAFMAEDFAAGRFATAFHPRFGIGLPICAGIVCACSWLDGLSASCFVATFAWALCIIPIYGIANMVFDKRTAWFAVILFLICPQTLLWGLKGLREPFKMLGVLLTVEAVLKSRGGTWWNMARAAVGFIFLAWFKVDSIVLLPIFGLAYAIGDKFRLKTWALFGAAVLILLPCCYLIYDWTGYFLPTIPYADIWRKYL